MEVNERGQHCAKRVSITLQWTHKRTLVTLDANQIQDQIGLWDFHLLKALNSFSPNFWTAQHLYTHSVHQLAAYKLTLFTFKMKKTTKTTTASPCFSQFQSQRLEIWDFAHECLVDRHCLSNCMLVWGLKLVLVQSCSCMQIKLLTLMQFRFSWSSEDVSAAAACNVQTERRYKHATEAFLRSLWWHQMTELWQHRNEGKE